MIPVCVDNLLQSPSKDSISALLEDQATVFLVDGHEEDDAIVEYCESVLGTGSLTAELNNVDTDLGIEIHISYAGKRVRVPLSGGPEDRHITLLTLNKVLAPDYEIRVCVDSNGSDTLAFLPLLSTDWSALDARYGHRVEAHFRRIEDHPNLFTERW
jgi:hypothetical protein